MHGTQMEGFTLIELVLVISLVTLLVAIPFFSWPGQSINLEGQAQLLANDIRYAQSLAMTKADRFRLARTSTTTYQILNSTGTAVTFPNGSTTMTLSSGIVFSSWGNLTNFLVAFDGEGVPYSTTGSPGTPLAFGTSYAITLTGGGLSSSVNITPITGRVY